MASAAPPGVDVDELALFAGAGGGILGGHLLGWRTLCAVEFDPYARSVLLARQRDGFLPRFPIWDDVKTFDGHRWRGSIDVVSGGFPCQDISSAGKGAGIEGEKSGLWGEMARIVCEVRPRFVFVENSPILTSRGLGVVLGDLAAMGYDARWCVLGAHHVGAPHKRDRIWILASDPHRNSKPIKPGDDEAPRMPGVVAHAHGFDGKNGRGVFSGLYRSQETERQKRFGRKSGGWAGGWWTSEPALGRVAHGVARRLDRLRALGNGQVPAVAALAWATLGGPS